MDKDQRGGMSMQKGIWQPDSWETWASFSVLNQLPGRPQWAAWGCYLLNPSTWGNNGIQYLPSLSPFPSACSSGPTKLHVERCYHLYSGWHPECNESPKESPPSKCKSQTHSLLSPQTTVPGFWHQSSKHPHPLKGWTERTYHVPQHQTRAAKWDLLMLPLDEEAGGSCDCFVVHTDLQHHHVP